MAAAVASAGPSATTTTHILVQPASTCRSSRSLPEIAGDQGLSPSPSADSSPCGRDPHGSSNADSHAASNASNSHSNTNSNGGAASADDSSVAALSQYDTSSMHNNHGFIGGSSLHHETLATDQNIGLDASRINRSSAGPSRSVRHSTASVLLMGQNGRRGHPTGQWQSNAPITVQPRVAHRTLTGASNTSSRPDPMLELLGWRAEPLLCRRLRLYIAEGAFELAAVIVAVYLSQEFLRPKVLFARLLLLPLVVVALKFFWSLRLACSYYMARKRDVAEVIQNMGAVHTRAFWSCSAATLTCLSCVLMVWHSIMFLLMTGYGGSTMNPGEEFSARYVLLESALFVLVNWLIWRDFVNHYKECPEEPEDVKLLTQILGLHRSRSIALVPYRDLIGKEETTSCIVCLESFRERDRVAQLPCGHIFHPSCAHRWILEDWRCPFRCPLENPKMQDKKESAPNQIPTDSSTATTLPETHSGVSEPSEVDLEAGGISAARH